MKRTYRYHPKHGWQYLGYVGPMNPLGYGDSSHEEWFAIVTPTETARFERETLLRPAQPAPSASDQLLRPINTTANSR